MQWLFLVHQVQTPNSRERVKVWRLTKKVGAVLYRNSVYVLPYTKERLEDFHWLCQQIRDSQGEASVFVTESADPAENEALRTLFNKSREAEYALVMDQAKKLSSRLHQSIQDKHTSPDALRRLLKELSGLESSFTEIGKNDFFDAPSKRRVKDMITQIKTRMQAPESGRVPAVKLRQYERKQFQGRTWATRSHIHIDRLCSAWLIRKFIDPKAKFVFGEESRLPKSAIPFDVFGAEFSHHGDDCSFETLLKAFRIKDKALSSIAQIVHDIDMKDHKFDRQEAAGVDAIVRAISDSLNDDQKTLDTGTVILDGLYKRLQS